MACLRLVDRSAGYKLSSTFTPVPGTNFRVPVSGMSYKSTVSKFEVDQF